MLKGGEVVLGGYLTGLPCVLGGDGVVAIGVCAIVEEAAVTVVR